MKSKILNVDSELLKKCTFAGVRKRGKWYQKDNYVKQRNITILPAQEILCSVLSKRTGLSFSMIMRLALLAAVSPHKPFFLPDYLRAEKIRMALHSKMARPAQGSSIEELAAQDLHNCKLYGLTYEEAQQQWVEAVHEFIDKHVPDE